MHFHNHFNQVIKDDEYQSSVEIYFSFYTVPYYIGIIRDQEIEYYTSNKDEILVNDDDYEDLNRISKLMGLVDLGGN